MKKKNMNQTETGRSMVEMLGVLAIIGVLSVGGIAGYTSAMNKHRANDTVQRVMRRAVIISSQKQLGQTATLSGFNENDGAYAITLSAGAEASSPTFTLEATNVPQDICEKINALSWPSATLSPTTCASGTQDMTFTFNNDLSAGATEEKDLGLKQNVPCGTGFCFEGQTCVEASSLDYNIHNILCDGIECCMSADDYTACNVGEFYDDVDTHCLSCSDGDFVLSTAGKKSCCSTGGLVKSYYGGYYMSSGVESYVACCTTQGGFVSDYDYCCKGDGYQLDGMVSRHCCGDGSGTVLGKKSDGSYEEIEIAEPGSADYLEWHCCKLWEGDFYDEGENKDFCDAAREAGI